MTKPRRGFSSPGFDQGHPSEHDVACGFAAYVPVAIVYRDSDVMEYVNCDHLTISERIDENLSILRDRDGKIVGMALSNWSKIRR